MSIVFNSYKTIDEAKNVLNKLEENANWFVSESRFSESIYWPISPKDLYSFEERLIRRYLTLDELKEDWSQEEADSFLSFIAITLLKMGGGKIEAQASSSFDVNNKLVDSFGLRYYSPSGKQIGFGGLTATIHWRIPQCYRVLDEVIAATRRLDPIFSPFFAKYRLTAVLGGTRDIESSRSVIDSTTVAKVEKVLKNIGYSQHEITPHGASSAFLKETRFGPLGFVLYPDRIHCLVGEVKDAQDLIFELLQDATEYLFPLGFDLFDDIQKEWVEKP